MTIVKAFRCVTAAFACSAAIWVTAVSASAQTPAPLPTAPGAERSTGTAPATAARASLPGDNGSPVEPYLFMFILAGGGIVSAIAVKLCDKGIRGDEVRWEKDGSRRVLGLPVI